MDRCHVLTSSNRLLAIKLYYASKFETHIHKKKFRIEDYSDDDCKKLFRFTYSQIKKLRILLLIPWKVTCKNGASFNGIEALCVLLRRLAYPNRLFDLALIFHRSKSDLSLLINQILDHIISTFHHLLTDLCQWWLSNEWLEVYADAVAKKGAPLKTCWGFIDGTVRPICRPRKFQKDCYNGHKRVHALKYQSIVTPNGLIANLFGPINGRRHDSFLLSESNILPTLAEKNSTSLQKFCLYGDPAYPLRPELQAPFKGSNLTDQMQEFNKRMSASRICVEWAFGKIVQLFAFVDFKKINDCIYSLFQSTF